jgi:hypothetical protein
MPLANGPIGQAYPAAREPCPPADPLPPGLDDLHLFASVILRQVRANGGTANAFSNVTRSTSSSPRPRRVDPATRSRRCGQADRRHPVTDVEWSMPIHLLLAELAGRWVHDLTTEEGQTP